MEQKTDSNMTLNFRPSLRPTMVQYPNTNCLCERSAGQYLSLNEKIAYHNLGILDGCCVCVLFRDDLFVGERLSIIHYETDPQSSLTNMICIQCDCERTPKKAQILL